MTQSEAPSFSELATDILEFDKQQQDFPIHSHDCNGGNEYLGSSRLEDVFTRFRLWVGNLGVLHKWQDPRGLDKRLQDAPEVAKRIRELLVELKDLLLQAKVPCECNDPNAHIVSEALPTNEEDALIMQLLGFETSSHCTASWLLASLEAIVRRLFTMSSMIAKSTTRDKFARAEVNCRLQRYESYDIAHVREKLKKRRAENLEEAREGEEDGQERDVQPDQWLADRLGKANTKRRQFLAYSQSHREALNKKVVSDNTLAEKPDEDEDSADIPFPDKGSAGKSACLSEGIKSSIARTKASTIADMDPNSFDYGYDDARSCTSVATSIMDDQAFSGLKVPLLSHYSEVGEHFICPMCQTSQRFNGQATWSKHVFSDIRAYICTARDCGMLMFDSLSTWRCHEMEHRRKWSCPLCSTSCKEEAATEAHLTRSHSDMVGPHNLETLLRISSHPSEFLLASDCPFCDWNAVLRRRNPAPEGTELSVPSNRFLKHLGKHLEELALFVVPQPEQDDENSDQLGSNAVHAAEADDGTTMSALSSFGSKVSLVDEALRSENSDIPAPKDWIVADNAHGAPKYGSGATLLTPAMLKLPPPKATTLSRSNTPIPLQDGTSQEEGTGAGSGSGPIEALSSQQGPAALAQEDFRQDTKDPKAVTSSLPMRRDPPRSHNGQYYCNFTPECADQYFDRKSEWSKHMDKHDRPYRCPQPECFNLNGFTYSGGLLRHEREVHFKHGGPKAHRCHEPECSNLPGFISASVLLRHSREVHSKRGGPKDILRCPVDGCKRHVGKAFSRMDGLVKHLGAVHGIKKSSAEIRRDYSFQSDSPDRNGSRASVGEHDSGSPDPILKEDLAPRGGVLDLYDKAAESKRLLEELKLKDLELQNERRSRTAQLERNDLDPAERPNLETKVIEIMLLERQNKKRILMARQEQDSMLPQPAIPSPPPHYLESQQRQDYDMQLVLLEQQNKKRLLMARQEQDGMEPQPAIPSPLAHQLSPAGQRRHSMESLPLEQQNRGRLLKAWQKQNHLRSHAVPYEQPAVPTFVYTPVPADRTMFIPETQFRARQEQEQGTALAETSMQAHTPHYSENNDFTLFDGPNAATLPAVEPSNMSPVDPIWDLFNTEYTTAEYLRPRSPSSWEDIFSDRIDPGFTYPQRFTEPDFGVPYSPTGSDNADAGSITSEPALENGTSLSGQAAIQQLHDLVVPLPEPNTQTTPPFRCDQCPQIFHRGYELRRHKRIHVVVKSYPCGQCNQSFSRKINLKRHLRMRCCGKPQPMVVGDDAGQELDGPVDDQREREQKLPPAAARDASATPKASRAGLVNSGIGYALSSASPWTNTERERSSTGFGKGKGKEL